MRSGSEQAGHDRDDDDGHRDGGFAWTAAEIARMSASRSPSESR